MPKNWLEPTWPCPSNIHAATTLRTGGLSQSCFASFNLGSHVGDNGQHVNQNREYLKQQLELPNEPIWLNQVHGDTVLQADLVQGLLPADASFTAQPGIVCTVMTADCLPVLFCSSDGQKIAAAHAGWRGLLAGILSKTCQAMQPNDIIAWLGPAIGPERFEVGTEVFDAFVQKNAQFAMAFNQQDAKHYLANIYQLARIELASNGISHIYGGNFCTYSDSERFFSYRRDGQTGRMATLIWRE